MAEDTTAALFGEVKIADLREKNASPSMAR
jgi:hypothetical protein